MEQMIVGMGEVLWDMLPDGKKIGGAPANFAYHVKQFGLKSTVISAIGDDSLGREIVENFAEKGVNHMLAVVPYATGTVQVSVDDCGIPQYEIKENVAWDNIPFTEDMKQLAMRTRAFCYGSLAQRSAVSRASINMFLEAMPKDDETLVVFDVNLRQNFYNKEVIEESLRNCNILKINDEELVIVSRMFGYAGTDLEEKCRALMSDYNLKILILTCGVNGSYVFSGSEAYYQPTPMVEVADTVGAGDSFTAAFVANLLKGESIEKAHKKAVETSAYVCTQYGAMPELPEEIKSR